MIAFFSYLDILVDILSLISLLNFYSTGLFMYYIYCSILQWCDNTDNSKEYLADFLKIESLFLFAKLAPFFRFASTASCKWVYPLTFLFSLIVFAREWMSISLIYKLTLNLFNAQWLWIICSSSFIINFVLSKQVTHRFI